MYRYKNRSSRVQSINLDSGKSIYVQPGEEVSLSGDDHKSPEVQAKIRGANPTGKLFEGEESAKAPEEDKQVIPEQATDIEVTPKKVETTDFLSPRNGEKG